MTMTIGDRLQQLRLAAGYETAADAARGHGWNVNTYRSHENGSRNVPREWLLTYTKVYRCSLAWLTTGREERGAQQQHPLNTIPIAEWRDLPERRTGMSVQDLLDKVRETGEAIAIGHEVSQETVALPVRDDSMTDAGSAQSLAVGDIVAVDLSAKVHPGRIALIYDPDDDQHLFRRAEFIDRKRIRFVALNRAFPPIELEAGSPHIIGVAVSVVRSLV